MRLAQWFGLAALICTSTEVMAEQPVTTTTLDNGMQVVVIEDNRAPVAVHMVWYRAGSADEPAGASGIAHFLEHLMFKRTDTLEPGEFSKTVAQNGGSDNAFTSYDYTGYFQRVAADRVGLMMQMEADRMVNLQLKEEDILTEREVIIEERNQRTENDPGALMREQMRAALYLNHRYGVPIIGWRHEMVSLDMDDALEFYADHYAPNNAILIVAGDVTPDEIVALAEEHYGPIPANPEIEPRARPQEPPQTAARRMVFEDPRVAQPYVMRSYLAPERDPGAQREAAALYLLSEVLGGSQTSVLAEALQFKTSKAVYAGAGYSATSLDDTTFTLVMVPSQGVSLEDGEAAMDAVVAEFLETRDIDDDQLARIKRQIYASQIYGQDNVQQVANRFGRALTAGLTVEDIQAWPDILQSITEEEIFAAADALFDLDRSVTSYLTRPADASEEITQ
ncbi:M16 family metallopeptidase [Primorskyibacter sp. S187A]|uniref:M16 family metallopeptidase n=1 Tax=Primorskyibacter sp. S187A TaxID=3415130 RepID=UPI003C7A55E2